MKKSFVLALSGIFSLLSAQAVLDPANVSIGEKGITVAPESKVLLDGKMVKGSRDYTFSNYKNILGLSFAPFHGEQAVCFDGREIRKGDTAWHISSHNVSVQRIRKIDVFVRICSSYSSSSGFLDFNDNYVCRITFRDAAKKIVGSIPITFRAVPYAFLLNCFSADVPANAATVSVSFGADSPNLHQQYVAFSQIKIVGRVRNGALVSGGFTSAHFPLDGGKFSWNAVQPKGTGISFQLAFAPDNDGKPGKWSEFGPAIRQETVLPAKSSDKAWVRYKVRMTPAGNKAPELLSVRLGKSTDSGWKVLYEDRLPEVKLLSKTPQEKLKTPVRLSVTSRSGIDWNTFSITLNGKDITKSVKRNGQELSYLPEGGFKTGLLKFVIRVKDRCGNPTIQPVYAFAGPKAKKGIVTVRDDGVTLIDGKPFFPIGLYAVWKRPFNNNSFEKAFTDIRAGGFNMVHTYCTTRGTQYQDFIDSAARHGLKLFVSGPGSANDADIDRILSALVKERLHPAMFAWYIGDDTADHNSPDQLKERTAVVRAVAPHLITTQADPINPDRGKSRFRNFAFSSDIFMPENYPVRGKKDASTLNCVAKVVEEMLMWQEDIRVTGAKNRGSWSIIQYFKGWDLWKRFPTPHELRGMTWASVIHGATGVTWYTYGGFGKNEGCCKTPEHWENLCKVAKELKAMSRILCLRTPKKQPKIQILSGPVKDYYKNPSVTCLMKEENGTKWLFAVNSSTQKVKAKFSVPEIRSGKVIFESERKISVANGQFEDEFSPQEVHIYELKK